MKDYSLANRSFASILEIMGSLNYPQMVYLLDLQPEFYQKRILNLLPTDLAEVVSIELGGSLPVTDADIEEVEAVLEMHSQASSPFAVEGKADALKSAARAIAASDEKENLQRLINLLEEMCVIARSEGIVALDFLFLREDGLCEDTFTWLLTEVTLGSPLQDLLDKSIALKQVMESRYGRLLFEGLSTIQQGANCSQVFQALRGSLDQLA